MIKDLRMQKIILIFVVLIGYTLAIPSCTKDKLPEENLECLDTITYVNQIKPILDKSCAYSGCHVVGYVWGDYSSYDAMEKHLETGTFEKKVISTTSMPPSIAPSGKPKSLSEDELLLIKCWAEQGYIKQ